MSDTSTAAHQPTALEPRIRPVTDLRARKRPSRRHAGTAALLSAAVPVLPVLLVVPVAFTGRDRTVALAALVAWALLALRRAIPRPGAFTGRQATMRQDLRAAVLLCAVTAFATVGTVVSPAEARGAFAVIGCAAVCSLVVRLVLPVSAETRRVVVVGSIESVEAFLAAGSSRDVVAGCHVVDGGRALAVQPALPVPTTTSLETIPELAGSVCADAVLVLPGHGVDADLVRRLSWLLERSAVTVGVVCPVGSVGRHRLRTTITDGDTVLEVAAPRARRTTLLAKAVLDRVAALLLLVPAAPVLALLWLAVRLDSPGPGFFVQTRVGLDGRPFRMFKLRTMHRDAESMLDGLLEHNESDQVLFKIQRDVRVTRVGYWLRRTSVDELPQLLNVLRGDMSLVGPRPALPGEVASYDHNARRRLAVKPGLTGLWQVSGRSDLLWEDSVRLDLYYTDNWRLLDDLVIAARTVRAVVLGRGAY